MHKSRNGRAPCTSVEALLYKNAALTGAEIVSDAAATEYSCNSSRVLMRLEFRSLGTPVFSLR